MEKYTKMYPKEDKNSYLQRKERFIIYNIMQNSRQIQFVIPQDCNAALHPTARGRCRVENSNRIITHFITDIDTC